MTVVKPGKKTERRSEKQEAWYIQPLQQLAVQAVAATFAIRPVRLDSLPEKHAETIVHLIPLDLPLETAANWVGAEAYWRRRCEVRFTGWVDPTTAGSCASWKQLFFESAVSEHLSAAPLSQTHSHHVARVHAALLGHRAVTRVDGEDESEGNASAAEANESLDMLTCKPFLRSVHIRVNPGELDESVQQLEVLDGQVSSVRICCAASDVGMEYDRRLFGMALQDSKSLCSFLTRSLTITRLDLSHNKLGNNRCTQLAHALADNMSVTSVVLAHNSIGNDGAEMLASMLNERPDISLLELNDNDIGDDGAIALAGALQQNARVVLLSLQLNQLGDHGAASILHSLTCEHTCIERLNIASNIDACGTATATAVQSALRSERVRLKELDLNNVRISDTHGRKMQQSLQFNSTLQSLKICNTGLSDTLQQGLHQMTQRNRSVYNIDKLFGKVPPTSPLLQAKAAISADAQAK